MIANRQDGNQQDCENMIAQQSHRRRFSLFFSFSESVIHGAKLSDLISDGRSLEHLFKPSVDDEDGLWWMNMENLTSPEIHAICETFDVHPLTIEDISMQESHDKIEIFPSYYFACFRSVAITNEDEIERVRPFNLYMVVFREGILSFSFFPNSHASAVIRRMGMLKDHVAVTSD